MKRRAFSIRAISLLLLLATLFSVLPLSVFAAGVAELLTPNAEDLAHVVILHDGAEKSSVTLAEDGKETLTALVSDVSFNARAWQIRTPDGEQWVNIDGKSGETLDVSMALVSSMLDAAGHAYLRHTVKDGDQTYASAPVSVRRMRP